MIKCNVWSQLCPDSKVLVDIFSANRLSTASLSDNRIVFLRFLAFAYVED